MKVFTVLRGGVEEGAVVTAAVMPSGHRVPILAVGEEGRGRIRCEIPVRLQVDSWREWSSSLEVRVRNLRVRYTALGDLRFEEDNSGQLEDEYIIVFLGWIGFRGWNKLEMASGVPVPADMVLGFGQIAQGEAGRMGAGGQWILKVHQGDILRFTVGGRLYGEPNEYMLVCGADRPLLYPSALYRLGRAYDE